MTESEPCVKSQEHFIATVKGTSIMMFFSIFGNPSRGCLVGMHAFKWLTF